MTLPRALRRIASVAVLFAAARLVELAGRATWLVAGPLRRDCADGIHCWTWTKDGRARCPVCGEED